MVRWLLLLPQEDGPPPTTGEKVAGCVIWALILALAAWYWWG